MPVTEAQRRANDKWTAANMKQVKLSLPNKEAEELQAYCDQKGIARTTFIRRAIRELMEREPLDIIE